MEQIILLGVTLVFIAPVLRRILGEWAAGIYALLPLSALVYLIIQLPEVLKSGSVVTHVSWIPSLGIDLTFRLDGLSLLFSLLISGIGFLVVLYAANYMHGHLQFGQFYAYLLLFMTAMLGLAWSDNLIGLFVFWELTSVSSYLLIGFDHDSLKARKAALQALLVTAGGGLALLGGLIWLGWETGTLEIAQINAQGELIRSSAAYLPILVFVLLGAFTKSAQFPFHFWLPGAMAAPTPVSAYLHSATMVKAGIYLLARLTPALSGTGAWSTALITAGLLTLLVGAFLALGQTDLKRLLAYTTLAALGMIILLLGLGTPLAVKTAMVFLLAHSLYKGALFLMAGGIDHAAGTRDVDQLGGLARSMPWTALGAFLAGLSITGLPPALGFIGKEYIYETALDTSLAAWLVPMVFVALVSVTAAAGWIFLKPFIGQRKAPESNLHENSILLWLPPLLLGGLGVLAGLFSQATADWLIKPAVGSVLATDTPVKLALWYGFTPMLLLSILTVLSGFLVYSQRRFVQPFVSRMTAALEAISPESLYNRALDGLKTLAAWQTALLQNGYLRIYLIVVVLAFTGLVVLAMLTRVILPAPLTVTSPHFYDIVLAGLIISAVFAIVKASSRLATVAILGLIGFSVALIYLMYGAPDLAMVQFAIETLTVILFVLVIYKLPKFSRITSPRARIFDILVSISAGILMTVLVLIMTLQPLESKVTSYYVESSLPEARGRNIVNVILVDFRGLDTLGEISVLALAAIGVYALVRFKSSAENRISGKSLLAETEKPIRVTAHSILEETVIQSDRSGRMKDEGVEK